MNESTKNALLAGMLFAIVVVILIYATGYVFTSSGYMQEYSSNSTMEVNVSKINYLIDDDKYSIETTDGMIFTTNKSDMKQGYYYTITINKHNILIGDAWKNKTWVSDIQSSYHFNYTMHYYNQSDDWYSNGTLPTPDKFEYL